MLLSKLIIQNIGFPLTQIHFHLLLYNWSYMNKYELFKWEPKNTRQNV